ncbi:MULTISPECIES: hypothetical protein [Dethiosulfovibrio]|uniref:hypothetical protein n=1 Tax=Dethiosulfovibrio TaxID=47054 RepID=UPI0034DCCCE8
MLDKAFSKIMLYTLVRKRDNREKTRASARQRNRSNTAKSRQDKDHPSQRR